jgi:2-hydroxychromene-2-carboxylate isomerase
MYVRWFSDKFSGLMTADNLDTSVSIEKFEMLVNIEIPVMEYLQTNKISDDNSPTFEFLIQSLQVHTERIADVISFDAERACADLGLPECKGPDFNDTVQFADSFFAYLENTLSDKLLKQEAKSSRAIFKQFTTVCHQKELSMVNSVCDLRDSLRKFAYSKCTHEMEVFSERFRALKKGNQFEGEPFEFDTYSVNQRVRPLAESLVLLSTPIIIQSMISFDSIVVLANAVCENGTKYSSDEEFLSIAESVGLDDNEIEQIEICLRVIECVECFDIKKFLSCFPKNREEEAVLSRVFTQKRIPNPLVSKSHSTIASIPDEEEDSDSASTFESARTSPLLSTT